MSGEGAGVTSAPRRVNFMLASVVIDKIYIILYYAQQLIRLANYSVTTTDHQSVIFLPTYYYDHNNMVATSLLPKASRHHHQRLLATNCYSHSTNDPELRLLNCSTEFVEIFTKVKPRQILLQSLPNTGRILLYQLPKCDLSSHSLLWP